MAALDVAQACCLKRFFNPLWKLLQRWLPSERRLRESLRVINGFVLGVIRDRRGDAVVAEKRDVLSKFLACGCDRVRVLASRKWHGGEGCG